MTPHHPTAGSGAEELKPCPFCGGRPSLDHLGEPEAHEWSVECPSCKLSQHADFSRSQAIVAWNRRTPPAGSGEREGLARIAWCAGNDGLSAEAALAPAMNGHWFAWRDKEDAEFAWNIADAILAAGYRATSKVEGAFEDAFRGLRRARWAFEQPGEPSAAWAALDQAFQRAKAFRDGAATPRLPAQEGKLRALQDSLDDAKELLQQHVVYGHVVSREEAGAALAAANGHDFDRNALRALGTRIINQRAAEARWREGMRPVLGDPPQPKHMPAPRALATPSPTAGESGR